MAGQIPKSNSIYSFFSPGRYLTFRADALPKNLVGIEAIALYYSNPGSKMEIPA